jgi:hypothetical protein
MRKIGRVVVALALLAALCLPACAQVVVDSNVALLVDPREPGAIRKAAADLARDLEAVLGRKVRVVEMPEAAAETVIVVAFSHHLPEAVARPKGWEVLRIQAAANPWPGTPVKRAVVLTGSDVRGTIYAVYEFAERFLKVDPLYWWTDNPPARQERVTVPDDFVYEPPTPTFHYRGWFMNDEDLLSGWRPGIADKTGIDLATWDRIFEALLRLKGDMIIPNTLIFPYEPQVRAAGERGLIISQHHMEPLGLNVYQWPDDVPYSFNRLVAAWRCAVSQYVPGQEIIWTVGLRGRYDRPFWEDVVDAPKDDAGRARLIREAISRQIEIVRKQRPNPPPEFILNSWMEGSGLLRGGTLRLPPDVVRVWADNGRGMIEDGGRIAAGDGVYYHTGVVGRNGNNLCERVPVDRIARELGRAAKAGGTRYMMLNPSNIRPHAMTTRAVMELAWDARPWIASAAEASDEFLLRWSREEFGAEAAPAAVRFYKAYFAAPARYAKPEAETMSDMFQQWCARELLLRIIHRDETSPVRYDYLKVRGTKAYAARIAEICREADPRWQQACLLGEQAMARVPESRRNFFQAHVLTQARLGLHANRMLMAIAEAASPDLPAAAKLGQLDSAMVSIRAIQADLHEAEYGKWAGFYTLGDWFVDIPLTLRLAEVCRAHLADRPLSPAEQETLTTAERINRENTSYVYITIKKYQEGQKVQFREE